MPRYVALLRGVSPMNAKMPELRRCYEAAGFTNVATVLASGNVVFDSRSSSEAAVQRKAADAMEAGLAQAAYPFRLRLSGDVQRTAVPQNDALDFIGDGHDLVNADPALVPIRTHRAADRAIWRP